MLIAGGAIGVAVVAAVAIAAMRERKPRRKRSSEPSFLGTLVRTTLISAARVLTTQLVERKVARLPVTHHDAAASEQPA